MAHMPYNGRVGFNAAGGGEADASRIQLHTSNGNLYKRRPGKMYIYTPAQRVEGNGLQAYYPDPSSP